MIDGLSDDDLLVLWGAVNAPNGLPIGDDYALALRLQVMGLVFVSGTQLTPSVEALELKDGLDAWLALYKQSILESLGKSGLHNEAQALRGHQPIAVRPYKPLAAKDM